MLKKRKINKENDRTCCLLIPFCLITSSLLLSHILLIAISQPVYSLNVTLHTDEHISIQNYALLYLRI
jgi:hypothetical protein